MATATGNNIGEEKTRVALTTLSTDSAIQKAVACAIVEDIKALVPIIMSANTTTPIITFNYYFTSDEGSPQFNSFFKKVQGIYDLYLDGAPPENKSHINKCISRFMDKVKIHLIKEMQSFLLKDSRNWIWGTKDSTYQLALKALQVYLVTKEFSSVDERDISEARSTTIPIEGTEVVRFPSSVPAIFKAM